MSRIYLIFLVCCFLFVNCISQDSLSDSVPSVLKVRKSHHTQRGPITDDADNQEKQQEDNSKPHKYRHYRCSKCVKDKVKSVHEHEIQHALELQEKFEMETQKGLSAAAFEASLASDEVYDSLKGLIIDPFANKSSSSINSTAVSSPKLRLRI